MTGSGELKAVLFDMDGVIIDSEPLWSKAEQQLLARRMLEYSPQLKTAMMGRDAKEAVGLLINHYNLSEGAEEIIAERHELISDLFKEHLQPVPNALELLRAVRDTGVKTGLVSSSPKQLVELAVNKLGIMGLFDLALSGDQVTRGKPAPDIYLSAAEKLGVDPVNCLVIEDAPLGVAAAKAAGMCCLAISTSASEPELGAADRVVRDFAEVDLALLQDLVQSSSIQD